MDTPEKPSGPSPARVRFGLILWVVSYIPFPVTILDILHNHGVMTSERGSHLLLLAMWGVQLLIGFAGLALAGGAAIGLVKQGGVKRLPGNFWRLLTGRAQNFNNVES